jgi:endonuclease YncB( thermonuclease family)
VVEPIRHRCWGINAPELKTGAPGSAARDFAASIAPPGVYEAVSYKPDDFGRPLVDLVLPTGLFSETMISAGHAVRFTP